MLAQHLKNLYQEPVYAIGIIPSPDEGRLYSYNAARSLTTLVNVADNTFIFDNAAWRKEGESIKTVYDRINDEIVRRFGVLFRAGEVGQGGVGEMVVDSSEIINTLRGGGITTVGFAKTEAISPRLKQKQGPLSSLFAASARKSPPDSSSRGRPLGQDRLARPVGRPRSADAPLQLSFREPRPDPAGRAAGGDGPEGVEKAAPGSRSSSRPRRSARATTRSSSNYVAAVVVLASIGDAPRIRDLLEMAKETKEEPAKQRKDGRTMFEDGIDPLFEKEIEEKP